MSVLFDLKVFPNSFRFDYKSLDESSGKEVYSAAEDSPE
jgi:hypothetical protein